MITAHSMKIRARWNSATTAKITPATRENVFATPDIPNRCDSGGEVDLHLSAEQIGERRPATTIGHMNHVGAGHHLEQLAGHLGDRADALRRHVDLRGG